MSDVQPSVRRCTGCLADKDLDAYYFHRTRNAFETKCKKCTRAIVSSYRTNNRQKAKAAQKAAVAKKAAEYRKKKQEYAAENKVKRRAYLAQRNYGLTPEQYAALDLSHCAACGRALRYGGLAAETPHIDHCHASGRFRGVLCRNCNIALGIVEESAEQLKAMAAYIERFK